MSWDIFRADGVRRAQAWEDLPGPPKWRERRASGEIPTFVSTPELIHAVNAALHLRRPLLLTGLPGSGKSTLVERIAAELDLGEVLRWHITSKSTLEDGLYRYDALGRLHATQLEHAENEGAATAGESAAVERFVTLGPLGTALAAQDRPRALLIDEIDKSDLDLPGDLLDVLERGEFEIPPLAREARRADAPVEPEGPFTLVESEGSPALVRPVTRDEPDASDSWFELPAGRTHWIFGADGQEYEVTNGTVGVPDERIPVIVLTSNGERSFPAPFLRRCVRFDVPRPSESVLREIVAAHFGAATESAELAQIQAFEKRLRAGETLALDQLLNFLHLVGEDVDEETRKILEDILLPGLSS